MPSEGQSSSPNLIAVFRSKAIVFILLGCVYVVLFNSHRMMMVMMVVLFVMRLMIGCMCMVLSLCMLVLYLLLTHNKI